MRQIHIFTESTNSVANEQLSDWVSTQIWGEIRSFGPHASLAVTNPNIIGGVIFHDYQPDYGTVEISAAGRNAFSRRVANAMFDFAFNKLGCQLAIARASSLNAASNRLISGVFTSSSTVIPRYFGRYADANVYTLTAEGWSAHPLYKGE